MERPLDRSLNIAILHIASRIFPTGYDVSENAPDSYSALKSHLDAGNRMLVYSGGSTRTIYGCPEVNYAFRAWHDWCHWHGEHQLTFEDEGAVCEMQKRHLFMLYGDGERTRRWGKIIDAEIIGQALYQKMHKRFPHNQEGFVQEYLKSPDEALLWPLW